MHVISPYVQRMNHPTSVICNIANCLQDNRAALFGECDGMMFQETFFRFASILIRREKRRVKVVLYAINRTRFITVQPGPIRVKRDEVRQHVVTSMLSEPRP